MNKPKFTIDTYQKRYLEHLCEFLKMFKGSCAHNTPYHPTPLALTKITFRLWDNPWRLHGSLQQKTLNLYMSQIPKYF